MHFDSPYRFNAKELDEESGLYYYGARYYNPMVSVWLGVDRLSGKYPSLTPYNFTGNNPIFFVDPNGDSLDVANNIARDWLLSIVSNENQSRVTFNGNRVAVNLDGLTDRQLKSDKGLHLISKMVAAEEKYLYEVGDIAYIRNSEGNNQAYLISIQDNNGIVNASDGGFDSNGGLYHLPSEGYNGQVSMAFSGSWTNANGGDAKRSVIFHELAENYFRTSKCLDFHGNKTNNKFGAHYRAARWEGNAFGNPTPGGAEFSSPEFNRFHRYMLFFIAKSYNDAN
jgi:RHS repeat-associated protein